jgi:hypothetical protein
VWCWLGTDVKRVWDSEQPVHQIGLHSWYCILPELLYAAAVFGIYPLCKQVKILVRLTNASARRDVCVLRCAPVSARFGVEVCWWWQLAVALKMWCPMSLQGWFDAWARSIYSIQSL